MAELRYNNEQGTLGQALDSTSTTIHFAQAPDFATLTFPDTILLCLDPGEPTFEIVSLTAYASGATSGTIARAVVDGANWPAVAHADGATWVNAPITSDFIGGGDLSGSITAALVTGINGTPIGTLSSATSGQVLAWNGTSWIPENAGTGTVSSITSTGSTISVTNGAGPTTNVDLPNVGTASTYGDATHVPQITTDAEGRITGVTNVGITAGGSGTVTSASVVSANGLAGTVANATTTPALTLSTTVTGLVKGNGTALSAATAGTDYVAPGGALGTPSSGTLTNATGLPEAGVVNLVSDLAAKQAGPLTGDVTTSGTAATLKNTGPGATGPLGSATATPAVTIDAQGRVTALSSTSIQIAESQVTSLTSDLAAKAPISSPTFLGTVTIPSGAALGTPASGTLTNCTFPTLNQNTSGTAANLSGTPTLPNGTLATTQSAADNTTKLATTAFVTTAVANSGGAALNLYLNANFS